MYTLGPLLPVRHRPRWEQYIIWSIHKRLQVLSTIDNTTNTSNADIFQWMLRETASQMHQNFILFVQITVSVSSASCLCFFYPFYFFFFKLLWWWISLQLQLLSLCNSETTGDCPACYSKTSVLLVLLAFSETVDSLRWRGQWWLITKLTPRWVWLGRGNSAIFCLCPHFKKYFRKATSLA